MGLFSNLLGWLSSDSSNDAGSIANNESVRSNDFPESKLVNPATGLMMTSPGFSGVDVMGSPYGVDIHTHNDFNSGCNLDLAETSMSSGCDTSMFENGSISFDCGSPSDF
jgi:hypothetical protein